MLFLKTDIEKEPRKIEGFKTCNCQNSLALVTLLKRI